MGDIFFSVPYFPVTCGTSYEDEYPYKLPCAMFFCDMVFFPTGCFSALCRRRAAVKQLCERMCIICRYPYTIYISTIW